MFSPEEMRRGLVSVALLSAVLGAVAFFGVGACRKPAPAAPVAEAVTMGAGQRVTAAEAALRISDARFRKVFFELVKQKAQIRTLISEVRASDPNVRIENVLKKYELKSHEFTVRVGSADAMEE